MNMRTARLALATGMLITLFFPWTSSLGYRIIWYDYLLFPFTFCCSVTNQIAGPTFAAVPIPIVFNLALTYWPSPNLLKIYRLVLAVVTMGLVATVAVYAAKGFAYGFWIYFALVCVVCIMEVIIYWRERALRK